MFYVTIFYQYHQERGGGRGAALRRTRIEDLDLFFSDPCLQSASRGTVEDPDFFYLFLLGSGFWMVGSGQFAWVADFYYPDLKNWIWVQILFFSEF